MMTMILEGSTLMATLWRRLVDRQADIGSREDGLDPDEQVEHWDEALLVGWAALLAWLGRQGARCDPGTLRNGLKVLGGTTVAKVRSAARRTGRERRVAAAVHAAESDQVSELADVIAVMAAAADGEPWAVERWRQWREGGDHGGDVPSVPEFPKGSRQ